MTPGIYVESVPQDLLGRPSVRVLRMLERVFETDRELSASVCLAASPTGPTHVWVSMLHSRRRGRGMGGAVLDSLCCACDLEGVTIEMQAVSLANTLKDAAGSLDQKALEAFYARRGFVPATACAKRHSLVRRPNATPSRRPIMRTSPMPRNEDAPLLAQVLSAATSR
jgi:GNAT superfamily N-acetyltransferase